MTLLKDKEIFGYDKMCYSYTYSLASTQLERGVLLSSLLLASVYLQTTKQMRLCIKSLPPFRRRR